MFLSSYGVAIVEDSSKRKGCASTLRLLCEHCGWKFSFCTSRKQGKSYEVSRRLVYGMRTIGKAYAGARKFCAIMNMSSPPTEQQPLHDHCPMGSASWCRYQQDKANQIKLYKHGPGLPLEVIAKLKPEYVRLSNDILLLAW